VLGNATAISNGTARERVKGTPGTLTKVLDSRERVRQCLLWYSSNALITEVLVSRVTVVLARVTLVLECYYAGARSNASGRERVLVSNATARLYTGTLVTA
jgi:hypothetical protein